MACCVAGLPCEPLAGPPASIEDRALRGLPAAVLLDAGPTEDTADTDVTLLLEDLTPVVPAKLCVVLGPALAVTTGAKTYQNSHTS